MGTINEMTALNDVSFMAMPVNFITIIGSNGAGKSTLMNCIAGVFPAETGKITLDGIDITENAGAQAGQIHRKSIPGSDERNGFRYDY